MLDRASRNLLACGGAAFTMRHKIHKWVLQNIRLVILRHGRSSLVRSLRIFCLVHIWYIQSAQLICSASLWSPVMMTKRWCDHCKFWVSKSLTWTSSTKIVCSNFLLLKLPVFAWKRQLVEGGDGWMGGWGWGTDFEKIKKTLKLPTQNNWWL